MLMLSLDIDIASPGFLHDFQTVQIEGLTYTFRLDASAGDVSLLGLDHGVGHSLLLLYDAKTSYGQKIKEFKGLDHNSSNASISLF